MTKTAAEKLQEAINSDPFLAGEDVHLDLTSYPHLIPQAERENDNFAMPDTMGSRGSGTGSSALKRFITAPDREAVQELRDPEALKKFDEQHGIGTVVHASGIPFKVIERDSKWHAKGTVNGQLHRFTGDSKDALYAKIMSAVNQNTIRALTDAERLQVVRIAASGDTRTAIVRYLEFAIGEERASRYPDPTEMLGDPALVEIFDDAAMVTWFAARPNVNDSDEWAAFLDNYAGNRPLSHSLMDGAWAAFEKQKHTGLLFSNVRERKAEKPPTVAQIDDLDDASVNRLMIDSKREYVRQVRAGVR
jgi:hypothetical protein